MKRALPDHPLDIIRGACLELPGVSERLSHGEPTWFVRGAAGERSFASYADHHHDDRVALWCAAPPDAQRALVEAEPGRFFVPPYVGGRGWLGMYLDVPVDADEVAAMIDDAYRTVASRLGRRDLRRWTAPASVSESKYDS